MIRAFESQPNPEGWRYLRSVVLFLSDGNGSVTDAAIRDLHEIADVTVIAYGDDADRTTLHRIASGGEVHVIGTEGGLLRQSFAEVGKTMTATLNAAP